jgi:hypothetical protein
VEYFEGKKSLGRCLILRGAMGCMDWIGLAEDKDWWRAVVNAVLKLRVPLNAVNFLTS